MCTYLVTARCIILIDRYLVIIGIRDGLNAFNSRLILLSRLYDTTGMITPALNLVLLINLIERARLHGLRRA